MSGRKEESIKAAGEGLARRIDRRRRLKYDFVVIMWVPRRASLHYVPTPLQPGINYVSF